MKKPILWWAAIAAVLLWSSVPGMAQYSGQAGGMDPSGNSTFGGGNSSSGDFAIYASALRLLHAEKYDEAIPYLEKVLEGRPRSVDILEKLGFAQTKTGDYPAALASLQKADSIDPDNKRVHQDLGELYLATHDRASADTQMAALNQLCPSGCDEKDALAKAIADAGPPSPATPIAH
ncbi:MAG TPA: tetratricopeptide repeat protein [Rhizomicrobium sp.]|jgi:tetratricopeptide (TPR) repeat protein